MHSVETDTEAAVTQRSVSTPWTFIHLLAGSSGYNRPHKTQQPFIGSLVVLGVLVAQKMLINHEWMMASFSGELVLRS